MSSEILLRFGLTIAIIAVGLFSYWLVNQRLLGRREELAIRWLVPCQ